MHPELAVSGTATQDASRVQVREEAFVSVIVPVVDRKDDLLTVYREFEAELRSRSLEYEFIFVFDGGFTSPPEDLVELSHATRELRIIQFERTFGESAALRAGVEHSRGNLIATVPAYFQVRPEGIHALLDELLESTVDLIVTRRAPRADGWWNRLQSRAFHCVVNKLSGFTFRDMGCGLRLMRREIAESLPVYGDLHRFIPAIAVREGYRVKEVDVPQHPLDARRRVYRPGVYVRRLLDIIAFFFLAKFTDKPLRFFGLVGLFLSATGALIGCIVLIQRLAGQGIANRPMLLLSVLLFTLGAQVLGLGLIGEIIVHLRSQQRSAYKVRDTT